MDITESAITWKQTRDGSWTAFNVETGEHYHNLVGAYVEARQFYAEPSRLMDLLQAKPVIRLIDPFLGFGYNTLACMEKFWMLRESHFPNSRLEVLAIERDPVLAAGFPRLLGDKDFNIVQRNWTSFEHNIYYRTHEGPPEMGWKPHLENDSAVSCYLFQGDTRSILPALSAWDADLVYHDPFSPKAHPELWTAQLFEHYNRLLDQKYGTVISYGAAAAMRSGMQQAGFHLYRLPVFTNKTGTIGAMLPQEHLEPLSPLEQDLMSCRSGLPYIDSEDLSWSRQMILDHRQERISKSDRSSSSAVHRLHKQDHSL